MQKREAPACTQCGNPVERRTYKRHMKHRNQESAHWWPRRCAKCRPPRNTDYPHTGAPIGTTRIQQLKGKKPYRWVRIHNPGGKCWIQEHRLVMEHYLGRKLDPKEIVHHKNEDTLDNRLENLELTSYAAHTIHHHTLTGRWAEQHDCCVQCGQTVHPHCGRGLCEKCYQDVYHRAHPYQPMPHMWAHRLRIAQCVDCGTSEREHYSGGRCMSCWQKNARRQNPERYRQYDQHKRLKKSSKPK